MTKENWFSKKHDYEDSQMQEALDEYMSYYTKFLDEIPYTARYFAEKHGVPLTTYAGKLSRLKKEYREGVVSKTLQQDSQQESGEGSDAASPEEPEKQELWITLADEQRKMAVLTLRKEYATFQEDSLRLKLKMKDLLAKAIKAPDQLKDLIDLMEDSYRQLSLAEEAGDDLAKQIIQGQKQINNILTYYLSPKAIKEMAQAQAAIEELMAKQFGLPYGSALDIAKTKTEITKSKLNESLAKKNNAPGDDGNTVDYSDFLK